MPAYIRTRIYTMPRDGWIRGGILQLPVIEEEQEQPLDQPFILTLDQTFYLSTLSGDPLIYK